MSLINWIVDDWRLKLLALSLAVVMLGAVAFAQNPPTTGTLTIGLNYDTAADIVILDPPAHATVSFSGLADVISTVTPANLTATVDASRAKPGTGVKLNVIAASSVPGVIVQDPPAIVVNIDTRAIYTMKVGVSANAASGYHITQADTTCAGTTPCTIQFEGPQSWEDPAGLHAVVVYSPPVNVTDINQPSQPITLLTNNGPLDTSRKTQPSWTLSPSSADLHIHATPGVTSNTVALVVDAPSQPPPAGYQITGVTVSPATVIITGDPAALTKVQRIILPAVDLSSTTTTTQFKVSIPYPPNISPLNGVPTATITYTIQRNPSVTPTP
jgi:YbbR domain-containing protein